MARQENPAIVTDADRQTRGTILVGRTTNRVAVATGSGLQATAPEPIEHHGKRVVHHRATADPSAPRASSSASGRRTIGLIVFSSIHWKSAAVG